MGEGVRVSVIVPAYNVEKYIEKCLLSILNQTYDLFEVIVVNDGSTDSTGYIIKQISENDHRIVYISTTNQGVSAARNRGLLSATGELIAFVDADDYLAEDYLSYMVGIMDDYNADYCINRNCFTKRNETQIVQDRIKLVTKEEALLLLLSPQVIVGCWNKMYRKEILLDNNILFDTALHYGEGLSFITKYAQISEKTVLCERKVYYYRRNNVTSATTRFDLDNLVNGERSLHNIKNGLIIHTKRLDQMWNHHMCLYSLGAMVRIKTFRKEKEYSEAYHHWKKYVHAHAFDFIFNRDLSLYRKLLLITGWFCPSVLVKLDVARRKRISDNSV